MILTFEEILGGMLVLLGIFMAMTFYRLLIGPSVPDRVVSIDLLNAIVIGIIIIVSLTAHLPTFLDVTTIIALIGFLGTIAFAYYIEQRREKEIIKLDNAVEEES